MIKNSKKKELTRTTSFEEFVQAVDWNGLDVNEQQGLFDVIDSQEPVDLGVFQLQHAPFSDSNMEIVCAICDYALVLTPKAKKYFKLWLENRMTHGEDGWAYLEWLKQIAKDD